MDLELDEDTEIEIVEIEEEEGDEQMAVIDKNVETEFAQISVNALAGEDVY